MKLIHKIIKIVIEYKYNKEQFLERSWGIDETHEIYIVTAEYYHDHYRIGTREVWYNEED